MANTTERRFGVIAGCLCAAGIAWLLMAAPAVPARPSVATPDAMQSRLYADRVPAAQADLQSLVAACRSADATDAARLRELAASPDPAVAGNAIAALGRLHEVHKDPALLQKLQDPRPRVRHEVIAALGGCGDPAAARLLVPLLTGKDDQARMLAIQGLAQLGVTDPLDRLLQDPGLTPATRTFVQSARAPVRVPRLLATTGGLEAH